MLMECDSPLYKRTDQRMLMRSEIMVGRRVNATLSLA